MNQQDPPREGDALRPPPPGRRELLQALRLHEWAGNAERLRLIEAFQALDAQPGEAAPLLAHRDGEVGAAAQRHIQRYPAEVALPLILDQVSITAPEHREALWRAFNAFPEEAVQRTLDDLLGSPRRSMGWEAVQHMTGRLRPIYLERMVREGPPSLRGSVLRRLLVERPPSLLLPLLQHCARDRDAALAVAAIEGLTRLGSAQLLDLMLDRFFQRDPVIQRATFPYLREMARRDPARLRSLLLPALSSGDPGLRQQGAELLLETGRQEEVLADILRHIHGLAGWLRIRLLETLRLFGDTLVLAAIPLLQHPEEPIQLAALALAEALRDPRLVDPVGRLLIEESWALRLTACDVLGRIGGERALRWLLQALDDPEARWAAVAAIGRAGAAPAAVRLVPLLKDPRLEIRLEVLQALAPVEDPAILPALLPALEEVKESDAAEEARTRAAEVLRDLCQRLRRPVREADRGTSLAIVRRALSQIDRCLAMIRNEGASDLHFQAGTPPRMRVHGQLQACPDLPTWDASTLRGHLEAILDARQRRRLAEGEVEFGHAVAGIGRFRGSAFLHQQGVGLTFRLIPNVPPTPEELRLPAPLAELTRLRRGLVLIAGLAGSGKSSTLAALLNHINEQSAAHILTVEDPIEFIHPPKRALISQREIGRHSPTAEDAMRAALREDPDVIAVGEIRAPSLLRAALRAALNGHLVLATLPTSGVVHSLDRVLRSFPPEEQLSIRMMLAETLRCISSQMLLPRRESDREAGHRGRVAAFEVLRITPQAAQLLRDGRVAALSPLLHQSRPGDARSRDRALQELLDERLISIETAHSRAERPELFQTPDTTQLIPRVPR